MSKAKRPCFIVESNGVLEIEIELEWFGGFALSQKQKCIDSLHKNIKKIYKDKKILEISRKSQDPFGAQFSAFNLELNNKKVELIYQEGKCFDEPIKYPDDGECIKYKNGLVDKSFSKDNPRSLKRFINFYAQEHKLTLLNFQYNGEKFELEPKFMFYDYIYIKALRQTENSEKLKDFDIFTDIEFNPKKQFNSQARSCALYSYMSRNNLVEKYMKSKDDFKKIYKIYDNGKPGSSSLF